MSSAAPFSASSSEWPRLKIADHVSWNDVDGELVLFNRENGRYHALNATASLVWRSIAHGMELPAVVSELVHTCDEDRGSVVTAVQAFVAQALVAGVLVDDVCGDPD